MNDVGRTLWLTSISPRFQRLRDIQPFEVPPEDYRLITDVLVSVMYQATAEVRVRATGLTSCEATPPNPRGILPSVLRFAALRSHRVCQRLQFLLAEFLQ